MCWSFKMFYTYNFHKMCPILALIYTAIALLPSLYGSDTRMAKLAYCKKINILFVQQKVNRSKSNRGNNVFLVYSLDWYEP